MKKPELTVERLRELLKYDAETGIFTWRVKRRGARAGAVGTVAGWPWNGYVGIRLDARLYYAHRLAWFYVHGTWPADCIDHVNTVRHDNRLCNLREADRHQNQHNQGRNRANTSGFKGVGWDAARGKWRAQIKLSGRRKYIGVFDTPELAHAAYCTAAATHHGDFARTH